MFKSIAICALILGLFALWVEAQPADLKQKQEVNKPLMKKDFPPAPLRAKGEVKKSKGFISQTKPQPKGKGFGSKLQQKKQELAQHKSRGVYADIYPPYMDAWTERWTQGTGEIFDAEVNSGDGYAYQSAGSYAWGMGGSRSWVCFKYTPPRSGHYRITLWAYQQGGLWVHTQYPGDEVYAYRNLGLSVDGVGSDYNCLSELYFNTPVGQRSVTFDNWFSYGKKFYLEAGRPYYIMGYSEIGGWSTGSGEAWQSTKSVSCLAPFVIELVE